MTDIPTHPKNTDSRWLRVAKRAINSLRRRLDEYPVGWSCSFVFLSLFLIYLLTATYDTSQSPDPLAGAVPAWQLAVHGNLNLDAFEGMLPWFVDGQDHLVTNRMPGIIFFGAIFYWLLPTALEEPTLAPAAIASATAAAAAMTVLHVLFRRLAPPSTALVAALLAGLATATWTVSADGLWPHGLNQLWHTLALIFLARGAWSCGGLLFGLGVFTRPHTAFIAAVAGVHSGWTTRSWRPAFLIALTSLTGAAALIFYNAVMFDAPIRGGYFERNDMLLPPTGLLGYVENIGGTLLSPGRGILILSPFILLLLPGSLRAWRVAPAWVRAGALGGVAYMLIHLALNRFSGGHNFYSYRLPIEMLTLTAPLMLLSWQEWTVTTRARRSAFATLAFLSVAFHALGAIYWTPKFEVWDPWKNSQVWEAGGLFLDSFGVLPVLAGGVVIFSPIVVCVVSKCQSDVRCEGAS